MELGERVKLYQWRLKPRPQCILENFAPETASGDTKFCNVLKISLDNQKPRQKYWGGNNTPP